MTDEEETPEDKKLLDELEELEDDEDSSDVEDDDELPSAV